MRSGSERTFLKDGVVVRDLGKSFLGRADILSCERSRVKILEKLGTPTKSTTIWLWFHFST